jgi:hypothetical protein
MNDPHVERLIYEVKTREDITFRNPPPVRWSTGDFEMELVADIASFKMRRHYSSRDAAKETVDRYLEAWDIDMGIHLGTPEFSFQFKMAEMIDRDPPPRETSHVMHASGTARVTVSGSARAHVIRARYPQPPREFIVSPDVDSMWRRYQGYLDGREPLSDMAYFCLTVVRRSAGALGSPSQRCRIAARVLSKLGTLTHVGTDRTARTAVPRHEQRDLTGQEKAWVEATVRALIRRMGEYAYDPDREWPQITMADLPSLS